VQVFENAIKGLGEDAALPAVQNTKRYLMRGIGVHHGGLIPVVKEIVEILFQESLIKALFATETFAMGLNMPARTVMFTTYYKHDGIASRRLTSGEYIQMSGRAGRRGKDARGHVVVLVEDPDLFSPAEAQALMCGKPMPLMSRFKLSYYTLLNLTRRVEGGMDYMDYLIENSFQQFQHEQQVPRLRARLAEVDEALCSKETAGEFLGRQSQQSAAILVGLSCFWFALYKVRVRGASTCRCLAVDELLGNKERRVRFLKVLLLTDSAIFVGTVALFSVCCKVSRLHAYRFHQR
jgi:replicative superfamily II helicase